ncbi:MAG: hypothetical protein PUF65_03605 [Lachnospiraceae bacterium]|nr:hypothetical protein [Lachnospiraceae bacterium]
MKWYHNLFVGDSIAGKEKKIKWKINHNAGTLSVYVIAFASNPENLLDIVPAWELRQKSYPKRDMKIIGLARGYDEALEVVRQIVDETYQSTGDVDVWSYLKEERRQKA